MPCRKRNAPKSALRFSFFPPSFFVCTVQVTDALQALPESATESILDQLKNPEGNDLLATVLVSLV